MGENETAKSSVINLEYSPEISSCFTGGTSPGLRDGDGRQRQFVGNAGVVDGERGRKHTVADDLVAARGSHHERGCSPAKGRAKIAVGHQVTPISLKTRMGGGRRSAAACQAKCGGPRGRFGPPLGRPD